MHEMGIALEIIEIVKTSIPEDVAGNDIKKIHLKVGKLSAIIPDSLRFCFEIVARDTAFAGAEMVIDEIPVVARCNECDHEWTIEGPAFRCEKCRSGSIKLLSGRELDIHSIEIADEGSENAE